MYVQVLFISCIFDPAILAQLAERRYRKPQVVGSTPTDGSFCSKTSFLRLVFLLCFALERKERMEKEEKSSYAMGQRKRASIDQESQTAKSKPLF